MAQRPLRTRRTTRATPDNTGRRASTAAALAGRLLESALVERVRFAEKAGLETYAGKRDVAKALGYLDKLRPQDFRQRYDRNEVAQRVVDAMPAATWRGGAELVENDDPDVVTSFEDAFLAFADRLSLWEVFRRADTLAQLGHYAVILIGAVGTLESELPRMRNQDGVLYLTPFAEYDAVIKSEDLVADTANPRFGLPVFYRIKRVRGVRDSQEGKVHWTRILHIADGLLDDRLYGKPALRAIWNRLDDLDKIVGAGAEAFWQKVQPGYQLNLDPSVVLDAPARKKLKEQIDEWIHGLRRVAALRGAEIKPVGGDQVADFDRQVDSIMSLVSAGTGIPKRILMGSERGELASQQDRSNWDQRVMDRRDQFAAPHVVRQAVTRFTDFGALPAPADGRYDVRWPSIRNLDDQEIAETAAKWAEINSKAGETVVEPDEIRDRVLGLGPLADLSRPAPTTARARRFLTKGRSRRATVSMMIEPGLIQRVEALVVASKNGGFDEELARLGTWIRERRDQLTVQ